MSSIINVQNLNKTFKLPHEKSGSIKSAFINFYKKDKSYEVQQVLTDVSFEIQKGEFFGIVGRNGSGKSTLLKILAGIYTQDSGGVTIDGKLTPFIELGVGFSPELSGRDNVYLNGALLGFSRKEMDALYADIVKFAELERFMDQKLKNYSSGMQVRLAFSIAIQAESDILLLDEVLAVGDEAFQRKCYEYFAKLKNNHKTVILVTHDMSAVKKYCDRALMIEKSKIIAVGEPRDIALKYEISNSTEFTGDTQTSKAKPSLSQAIQINDVSIANNKTKLVRLSDQKEIQINVDITVKEKRPVQFNLYIVDSDNQYLSGINTTKDISKSYTPKTGKHQLTCTIDAAQFNAGEYTVNVGAYSLDSAPELIDIYDSSYGSHCPKIIVSDRFDDRDGKLYFNAKWKEA